MLSVALRLILPSQYFACFLFLLVSFFSVNTYAQSFSATGNSNGEVTFTWSNPNPMGKIWERVGSPSATAQVVATATPGSNLQSKITRAAGTYYYYMESCKVDSRGTPYNCVNKSQSTPVVIQSAPPATATANFNAASVNESGSAIFSWSSTNTSQCSSSDISGVNAASGSITFYAPGLMSANQTKTITITCTGIGGTASASASLGINWLNDMPVFSVSASVNAIEENVFYIPFSLSDEETANASIQWVISSGDQSKIANADIVLELANNRFRVTPKNNANGNVTISLRVTDAHGGFVDRSVNVAIANVNDSPSIGNLATQYFNEGDKGARNITISVSDIDTPLGNLVLSGSSNNTNVVSSVSAAGSGDQRTLTFSLTGAPGTATLALNLSDGSAAVSKNIIINVADLLAQLSVVTDDGLGKYTLSWKYAKQSVYLSESGPNGPRFVGEFGASGTQGFTQTVNGTYTYSLQDCSRNPSNGVLSCTQADSKSVSVNLPVNHAPTISSLQDKSFGEGTTTTGTIPFTVTDIDGDVLNVTASSENKTFLPDAKLILGGSGNNRTFTANLSGLLGSSTITLSVSDGKAPPVTKSFKITTTDLPAQFSVVNNNGAGSYSISWRYATTAIKLFEQRDQEPVINVFKTDSILEGYSDASGSRNFNKNRDGLYSYQLQDCSFSSSPSSAGDATCITTQTGTVNVTLPVPAAPVLNLPATTSNLGDYSVFWLASAGSNYYELFENDAIVPNSGDPLYLSKPFLSKASGLYRYKVRACNKSGCGSFSPEQSVRVNYAPTISLLQDKSFGEGTTTTGTIPFSVTDIDGDGLNVTASSENKTFLPDAKLILGGSGNNRTFTANLSGLLGSSTITLSVSDGKAPPVTTSFKITTADLPAQFFVENNNGAGSYSISWRYATTAIKLFEQRDQEPVINVFKTDSILEGYSDASGSRNFNKTRDGLYSYQLQDCSFSSSPSSAGDATCITTQTGTVNVTLPVPAAPVLNLSATTSNLGDYAVSWLASAGSNYYELFENDAIVPNSGDPLYLSKPFLSKASGLYRYKVRACNKSGCGTFSPEQSVKVANPLNISGLNATLNAISGVTNLMVTTPKAATYYEVQTRLSLGLWGSTQTFYTSNITLPPLTAAGSYQYQARACDRISDASGSYSNCSSTWVQSNTVTMSLPGVPVLNSLPLNTTGTYTLAWNVVNFVSHYVVNENGNDVIPTVATNSYGPVTKPNNSYAYKVKACNAIGCSAYSAVTAVVVVKVGVMGNVTASLNQNSAIPSLVWAPVSDATRYEIQPLFNNQPSGSVITVTTTSTNLSAVTQPGNYSYKVKACAQVGSANTCSPEKSSNIITPIVPTSAPSAISPLNSITGSFTLKWNAIDQADKYEVFENGTKIATVSVLQIKFEGATAKTSGNYQYQVRACRALCGPMSNIATTQVLVSSSTSSTSSASSSAGSIVLNEAVIDPLNDAMPEPVYKGALTGSQAVGADGSFNYSLPLNIPTGINGMQPKLQLSYNSNSKNGLLGWGWSLGGLSAISRCNATIIRDGYVSGIQATDRYQYCIDGQRLVEIAAGEYRTEAESFMRIKKINDYWEVTNNAGLQSRYGFNSDSKLEDDQNQSYIWYLDQQQDIANNSWSVTYSKLSSNGVQTHYPHSIQYTNTLLVSGLHRIIFHYEDRSDVSIKYAAGMLVKTDKRLNKVELKSGNNTVSSYVLSYQQDGQTYHSKIYQNPAKTSRLAEIKQCVENSLTDCTAPIEFDWSAQVLSDYVFTSSGLNLDPDSTNSPTKLYLDINGDGNLDLYAIDDTSEIVEELKGYDSSTQPIYVKSRPSYRKADINRDGYDDVVKEFKTQSGIFVYLSDGINISAQPAPGYSIPASSVSYLASKSSGVFVPNGDQPLNVSTPIPFAYTTDYADVNGDGLLDVIRSPANCYGTNFWCKFGSTAAQDISVALNTGAGFSAFTAWYNGWSGPSPFCAANPNNYCQMTVYKLLFVDLNGDSASDFLALTAYPNGNQYVIAGYNNGLGQNGGAFSIEDLTQDGPRNLLTGDFNGDGLIDLATMPLKSPSLNSSNIAPADNKIVIQLGVGTSTINASNVRGFASKATALSDMVTIKFCGNQRMATTTTQEDRCSRAVIDFNNDGFDDIVEWGGRVNKQCVQVPLPANLNNCRKYKSTYTDYEAKVYLSLGGGAQGGISFAAPVTYKDLATIQSISALEILPDDVKSKTVFDDYNNDGAVEDDRRLKNNIKANRIEAVNESARRISVQYEALVSDEIYQSVPDAAEDEPYSAFVTFTKMSGKRIGVKEVKISNGVGGTNKTTYKYKGSKTHGAGYGDLGFAEVEKLETVDGQTPLKTITKYYQRAEAQYKLAGRVKQQLVYTSNAAGASLQKLSDTRNQWKVRTYSDDLDTDFDSPHYFAYLYQSSNQTWDLDGTKIADSQSWNHTGTVVSCEPLVENPDVIVSSAGSSDDADYSADGVLLYSQTATCDQSGSSAAVQIKAMENLDITAEGDARGLVGKRKQYAWVGTAVASAAKSLYDVRTQSFSYNDLGQLATKTIEPEATSPSSLKLTSTYLYNSYGSVSRITDTWDDVDNDGLAVNSRVTSIAETYDANGVRKLVVTKPLNIIETTEFHPVWGSPTKQTDANNLVTETLYDEQGRPTTVNYADGTSTKIDYRSCSGCFSYHAGAVWYKQVKTTGSSAVRSYYDGFNREVGSRTSGLDGTAIYSLQTYNSRGDVHQSAAPFFYGENQKRVTTGYDVLGRVISISYPDNSSEIRSYSGLTHSTTNRLNQTQTRHLNAAGWVMQSVDNAATPVDFTYWPFGDLKTTQVNNNAGTLVSVFYDALGRKTEMTDPNTGTTTYTYNALDLIATQTDAKNQRTCFGYDALGRQTKRVDNASSTCTGTTQNWVYDTKAKGKGQLGSMSGINTDGSSYTEQYTYTSFGLPQSTTSSFDTASYTVTQHYDAFNRPLGVTYPTGYVAVNSYNSYGHLDQVKDSTNTTLWTANEADALGNLKQFTLGNGVVTDQTYDANTGRISSIYAAKGSVVIQNQSYQFDALGNLTEREDRKNIITQSFCYDGMNRLKAARFNGCSAAYNDYNYDPLGNLTTKEGLAGTLGYGTSGSDVAGPHAVTSANGWAYKYDAIGNLTSATKAGQATKTVSYSPFNTPTSITQGTKYSTLVYGPNQERIKHSDSNDRVTKYVGGIYEEVTKAGITQKIHYVGDFALVTQTGGATPVIKHEYLHRDHIGSIVAISKSTIASANDVQWQSNGAWGERRYQQWNGPLDNLLSPDSTAKGFTDHEHLDAVGLIHMNGRVYDPELGRFMSADPFVQAPYNSQSYNRYSYVFNNPLSFTDPSGYTTDCKNQSGRADSASGDNCSDVEDLTTYGDKDEYERQRQRQEDAIRNSTIESWRVSESGNQHWAYYGGAAYNIGDIHGMTAFALAAGGYFPDALRKEITSVRPMDVLDFIARGDGLLHGSVLDAAKIYVSSSYNAIRDGKPHVGIDLTAHGVNGKKVLGVGVLSGTSGVVARIWRGHSELGNAVSIKTGALYFTYAHLSKIAASLKNGATVALGDKIGVTGCTGRCSGEHLHLQIKDTLQKGPNSYSPGPDYNQKGWLP